MIWEDEEVSSLSYWPSVSDLFMTLFIVAVALVGIFLFVFVPCPQNPNPGPIDIVNRLKHELGECNGELAKVRSLMSDKPPIIVLSEAEGFFFPSGSAALTTDLEAYLGSTKGSFEQIVAEIFKRNERSETQIDTLEIIGHTDGEPLLRRCGNLDQELPAFLDETRADLTHLKPGSNNDLGLLRALATKQAWERFIEQHPKRDQLECIGVRTYSAGQTVPAVAGRFALKDEHSRRIELRLTRLGRIAESTSDCYKGD